LHLPEWQKKQQTDYLRFFLRTSSYVKIIYYPRRHYCWSRTADLSQNPINNNIQINLKENKMSKNTLKILGVIIAALLAFGAQTILAGDTSDPKGTDSKIMSVSEHPCLHMQTWGGSAFIPYTVSTTDTIVNAPFSIIIYEYAPYGCPAPGNTMTAMQSKLSYDDEHWRFIGAEPTANWPNDFQWDTLDIVGSNDYIRLYFTLGQSGTGVPTPTIAKSYATLKFVSRCQPELSYSEVPTIWDADHFNQVTIDGNTWWLTEANSGSGGLLSVKNYWDTSKVGSTTISRLITEEPEIEVPIKVSSNFKCISMDFSINYNSNKLEFLELTNTADVFSNGCGDCAEPGDNPIVFNLFDIGYVNELADAQVCKLKFKVKAGWEGDTAQINFNTNNCRVNCAICPSLSKSYEYKGGVVTVTPYHAELKTTWDPSSPLISKSGGQQTTYFWGEVKNGFPTAHAADAIRFNYFTGNQWYFQGIETCLDCVGGLTFNRNTYEDTATVYQTSTGGLDLQANSVKVVRFGAAYRPGVFTPTNYENRYVPLVMNAAFQDDGGPTYYAHVTDETGTVTATVPNGRLTLAGNGMAEVKIGQFLSNDAVSQSVSGSQPLYIKWNFNEPLTQFSVQVSCSRVTNVVAYPGTGVTVTGGSGVYTVSYSGSMANPGVGTLVRIATVYYTVSCPYGKIMSAASISPYPQGPYYSSATVYLINPIIKTGVAIDEWAVSDTSTVTGLCPGYTPRDDEIDELNDLDPLTKDNLPTEFQLYQNHPNPFNPETIISYDVPKPSNVKIVIMNILGQEVATLVDESKAAGNYEIIWRGTDNGGRRVSSGVYLCVMKAGSFQSTVKMSLMK
jgi:hypothetical protein